MRIVIELDGTAAMAQPVTEPATPFQPQAAPTDGGGAPDSENGRVRSDSDGGGPSADLLASIAAAEGADGYDLGPSGSADGGAAPSTL